MVLNFDLPNAKMCKDVAGRTYVPNSTYNVSYRSVRLLEIF